MGREQPAPGLAARDGPQGTRPGGLLRARAAGAEHLGRAVFQHEARHAVVHRQALSRREQRFAGDVQGVAVIAIQHRPECRGIVFHPGVSDDIFQLEEIDMTKPFGRAHGREDIPIGADVLIGDVQAIGEYEAVRTDRQPGARRVHGGDAPEEIIQKRERLALRPVGKPPQHLGRRRGLAGKRRKDGVQGFALRHASFDHRPVRLEHAVSVVLRGRRIAEHPAVGDEKREDRSRGIGAFHACMSLEERTCMVERKPRDLSRRHPEAMSAPAGAL
ncbi:hypothetical protein KCV01_g9358, partial [Aureobasidium melanogenum]